MRAWTVNVVVELDLVGLAIGPMKPTTFTGGCGASNGFSRSPGLPLSENAQIMSLFADVV